MLYITLGLLFLSVVINVFLIISLKRAFFQIDELENWLIEFKKLVNITYNKLKNVDERGMFEKDDDVGLTFKDILNIIKLTNDRIQTDDNDKTRKLDEKNQIKEDQT